jgi:hypothetical protein
MSFFLSGKREIGLQIVRISDSLAVMDAETVIAAFGGPAEMARRFGAGRTAVYHWRVKGVPSRYWVPILDAAQADGLDQVTREAVMWRPSEAPKVAA